ncbi:hypothetical protein ILUMI_23079 [Ignelater luminosus]|uniref:Uncharacterized protein n=1 Tax=Ignelater luminosus TaxID=2038154 RepID=A0A8K0CFB4_IGNLU|nr:hypothetical protein ILUMI_23079 [Ignelater luminosus]
MDSDKLYDSLDEEFASSTSLPELVSNNPSTAKKNNLENVDLDLTITEELLSKNHKKNTASNFRQRCIVMNSREIQENLDISSIVPLYSGDKYKSELGSSKKSSSIPLISKKRCEHYSSSKDDSFSKNGTSKCRRRLKFTQGSCSNIDAIVQATSTKSYLGMFHSRVEYSGASKKKELDDTARSLFGDSQRSLISQAPSGKEEFLDAEDNHSDTTSFYFNQIENEKINSLQQTENRIQTVSENKSKNLKSITDIFLTSRSDKIANKKKPLVKKATIAPLPILGRLGPDSIAVQEKMERRKKQLQYGQKASNRNRIKMVELSVLKSLKNEMENSNIIDENHKTLQI